MALNISDNSFDDKKLSQYSSFRQVTKINIAQKMAYWVLFFFIFVIIASFLPWTQNIPAKGKLTTLHPDDRPQSVYSTISGQIDKWYVREGQNVKKGDTLAHLTEVKSEYFDPKLLERTQEQVDAKIASLGAYDDKAGALSDQMAALEEALKLKLEQTYNKIEQYKLKISSDSMEIDAAVWAYDIAEYQFKRTDTLHKKGIKSLTELEDKRNKMQASQTKLISCKNKYLTTKSELINAYLDLNNIRSEYADKLAKVRSDRFSAFSSRFDAESQISKLENTYANYFERNQYYYIIAPQDGYITKILRKGLGEIVKEAEPLLTIMPAGHELAAEIYIRPMDYPLLKLGQQVRFIFDGWPAFVFAGWPEQSYGTFGGEIVAIDNIADEKGTYRVLVSPAKGQKPWPTSLCVGTGASGMIMLNDVPLWYEFWRQLNGFPPDFYDVEEKEEKLKLKSPASQFKK